MPMPLFGVPDRGEDIEGGHLKVCVLLFDPAVQQSLSWDTNFLGGDALGFPPEMGSPTLLVERKQSERFCQGSRHRPDKGSIGYRAASHRGADEEGKLC
jgi:hypothetical protein